MGKLDNTLIIYISGDNGAAAEGSPNGTPSEVAAVQRGRAAGRRADEDSTMSGARSTPINHMAVGLDLGVRYAVQMDQADRRRFFGGTRQGMAISWPERITDNGGIRHQFGHVIDIVPTILEATGIRRRSRSTASRRSRSREPASPTPSTRPTPTRRRSTYPVFRDVGRCRGIYNDGWMLSRCPSARPGSCSGAPTAGPCNAFKWELYDTTNDWTQYTDVAAANPQKVKEMQDLFRRIREVSGPAARCVGATRHGDPAPEPQRGPESLTYSGEPVTGIPDSASAERCSTPPTRSRPRSRCRRAAARA